MKYKNSIILPANICSCRVLSIPPVGKKELDQIIRYKLSSYYPGSIEDLKIDYIAHKTSAIVFYLPISKWNSIKEGEKDAKFFSSYHLLLKINNKNGFYALSIDGRLDVHEYENNELLELRSYEDTKVIRDELANKNVLFVEDNDWTLKNSIPLFIKKKNRNYLLQILILFAILAALPQFAYYRQVQLDEQYLDLLKSSVNAMTIKNTQVSSTEEELNQQLSEYNLLLKNKPLNIYSFLSDLSFALGPDVEIESLVLKNNSFQMNGKGNNPLGKMVRFQENESFQSVIPYQVQSVAGSSKEKFSLTGMYGDE